MLPRKTFSPEAVLRLVLGLMVTYSGIMLVFGLFGPHLTATSAGTDLMLSMMVEVFALHGSVLAGIALTLRAEGMGWAEGFGFRSPPVSRAILVGLLAGLLATPVVLFVQAVIGDFMNWMRLEPVTQQVVKSIKSAESPLQQACFGIVTIGVAPVVEELLFRGVFYPSLKQFLPLLSRFAVLQFIIPKARGWKRRRLAAWLLKATQRARGRRNATVISMVVISFLFACAHVNTLALVPLFLLALLLTCLYEKTGNLLTPIFAHSLFNAANFFLIVFEEPLKRLLPP